MCSTITFDTIINSIKLVHMNANIQVSNNTLFMETTMTK